MSAPVKVCLGRVVATPRALAELVQADIDTALARHIKGDWGDVTPDDGRANDQALIHETRLFSAYQAGNGTKFWIITEADRSVTTVLLPEDY